ncbi:MAG: hydrogenase nickel incorporation protein HypB [Bacillota bacterium]
MKVILGKNLLSANAEQAAWNRNLFRRNRTAVVNLISSPGSGKTTLLEKTAGQLGSKIKIGVIVGDLYTDRDARRLEEAGAGAVQINTGGLCHLNAGMVARALEELEPPSPELLFIENVGNLVCPAAFDLGEQVKVALLSVAEGSDKPAKYPGIFMAAAVTVISKADLLPHTDFDLPGCIEEISEINGPLGVFVVSARTGQGLDEWCRWLEKLVEAAGKD